MSKNFTIVYIAVELLAFHVHVGCFRGQYDSVLAQFNINSLPTSPYLLSQ